ncbi:MMPL family transporter [Myxococcota bacterium]|nr:MMPL family transporter [Myxococcota bacterium]
MTFRGKSYALLVSGASTWCLRHPAIVFSIAALLTALGAVGVAKSAVDPSPETYLEGTELWADYARIDHTYEIGETVVVAFRELGGTVFDVETVGAVAQLDKALNTLPSVQRVLSIASATALDREKEDLDLRQLLPAGPVTKESAIQLATRIRRHPVYGEALVDASHETTFVFAQLSPELKDPLARIEAAREIRQLADTFRAKHRTVHLAGSTLIKEALASSLARDTIIFFPAIVLLLVLLLWIIYGELVATIVPLSVIGVSSMSVIGLFAALGQRLNLSTVALAPIIVVVGLAESIHFLSELRRQHARVPEREVSLIATVKALAIPCLVTSSAAAAGFLSLAWSPVKPLRELGYASAVGLLLVYVCTMLLTPALLAAFKFPRRRTTPFASATWVGKTFSELAIWQRRHIVPTIGAAGLVSGAVIATLTHARIDSSFLGYLDEEHRLRQDIAIIERTLGGAETMELVIEGKAPNTFNGIDELARLDRLKHMLQGTSAIHSAFSVADYLKIANAVMTGSKEDTLPESAEAVAQLMVIDPTPFSAFTSAEMQDARMTLQVRSMSSEGVLELAALVEDKADAVLAGGGVERTWVTGLPVIYARLVEYVVHDAATRFSIALVCAWIVLMIGLRSVAVATVAMVPTALAFVFTIGVASIAGIGLDTNLIFVGAVSLGIAINSAVHVSERYQRAREEGSPTPNAAVLYAATHGGHPIVIASGLLMLGFLVLCLSSFVPTLHMGVLGLAFTAFALAFDLALLPMLLMVADWLENRHAGGESQVSGFRKVSSMLTSSRPERTGTSLAPPSQTKPPR